MKIPFPFDGEVGAGLKPALTVWVIFILRCARAGHGGLYKVKIANNGERALKLALTDTPPDIILLDIMMPVMDGYETCRHLKESPATMNIPVIFLTGKTEIEDEMKGFELGAVDYITKPISPPIVLARVQTHLHLKRVRDYLKDKNAFLEDEVQRRTQVIVHARHQWERTFDTIPDFIMLLDKDHRILRANQATVRQFGKADQELLGRHCYEVVHGLSAPPDFCPHTRLLDSVKEERSEYLEAGLGLFLDESTTPFWDELGQFVGSVHVARDITGRKLAEGEKASLEAQLLQAQKMDAIGTLAGGVAHDFNNILGAIIGYTEMAMDEDQKGVRQKYLQENLKGAERAKDLVRQILTFSRQESHEKKPLDIKLLLNESVKFLRASIPATIEIQQQVTDELCSIMGDPTQMHQIIMNLCTNATHAMKQVGGVLTIELAPILLSKGEILRHPDLKPGPYLRLTVSDTGHGIEPANINRIFDPFFTTKSKEEGTGLGLSVVYGIIKSHDGAIHVHSEPGKGASFIVYLPRIIHKDVTIEKVVMSIRGGTEQILLVDDEPALVDICTIMLSSLGYQITGITSSIEALELFRAEPERFDLVITDMTLPKMTGLDLSREILQIRPDIPIILCSGIRESDTEDQALSMGIKAYCLKPLTKRDLSRVIRETLDGH